MFTLVILAYNEENFIKDTVLQYVAEFENIIIIDDASSDDTYKICSALSKNYENIQLIQNKKNVGAGESLNIGIRVFLESNSKYLIKIDGDNQFKYDDVIKIKNSTNVKNYDFSKCDRFWEGGIEGNMPAIRYFGNAFASLLLKITTANWSLNDPLNGLFLFSRKSVENFSLPKLFRRYGYPFYLSTYFSNISIKQNLLIKQVKNTISYDNQNSNLSALNMFFKLMYFTLLVFFQKIKTKLQYSGLQISAILDIFGFLSFVVSIFCLVRFFLIRYGTLVASQANWFIVFLIFFFIFIYLIFQSQKIEYGYKLKYFEES